MDKHLEKFDDSDIVDDKAMAKKHGELVDNLKDSLIIGQAGFLQAGKFLHTIHEEKTYKAEDSANEVTFHDFCQRTDIPLPGRTAESRRRTANTLIRIYKQFVVQSGLTENQLAPIGWTKLDIVASVIDRAAKDGKDLTKEEVEDWVDKAKELTVSDLSVEASNNGMSLHDVYNCKHEHTTKITIWKCDNCKASLMSDPNKDAEE